MLRMALFDLAMFALLATILLGLSHFTYGGPDRAQDAIVEWIERPMTLQGASADRWVTSLAAGDDDDKTCIRSLTPGDTEDDDEDNDEDVWTYEGACSTVTRAVAVAGSDPVETVRVARRFSGSYARPTLTRSINLVGGYLEFFEPVESPSTDPANRPTSIAGIDIRALADDFNPNTQSYGTAEITIDGFHINGASGSGIYIAAPTDGVIPFVIGPAEVKLTIKNSWIHNNSGSNGGGIFVSPGVKATVTLENVYIYDNTTTGSGGGVYMAGANSKLIAKQTIIYDNTADSGSGGGVYVASASLDIGQNSEINGNSATSGGGLYVTGSLTATVAGITMTGNTATDGAGIYSQNSSLVVGADTNIGDNTATGAGGGIYLNGGAPTVGAAILVGNEAASGGGLYLNATSASVSGASVMSNSVSGNGGGVYIQNSSAITVSSLTLLGNAASAGGGIYVTGGANVTFAGNTGIGNLTSGSGGGFHATSTLVHLNGNVWTGNTADVNGAGVYLQSANNSTLKNETAQENIATASGGGLYITGSSNVVIDNFLAEENEAQNGGGIYAASSTATLNNPTLQKNETSQNGGGLYATGSTLAFGGSATISQNIADGSGGGGYWTGDSVGTFAGLILSANEADHGGGFYVTNARLAVAGPTLIQANKALNGNGGGFHFAPSVQTSTLSDLIVQNNTATGSGGGLYADDADLAIGTAHIQANEANDGGGLYLVDNTLNVTGTFTLQANEASSDGGGLYALRAPITFAAQATIAENSAGGDGGGAFLDQPTGGLGAANFALLTLSENNANGNGGGVYANRVAITFAAGSAFNANTSLLGSGGAFYVEDADLALPGVTLDGNSAFADGGGVYLSGANLAVNASTLTENQTLTGSGGALYAASSPSVVISGTTASKNVASLHGGAFYATGSASTLQNNLFGENSTGQGSGGAIYLTGGTGSSTGGTFNKNVAKTSGGAIYAEVASLAVANATVTENGATDGSGGGLYIDATMAQLTGSTLSKNSAASGGGLYLTKATAATLTGNTIGENTSAGDGGGLIIRQATASLLGNTIRLNQAGGSGGGLYLLYSRVGITNSLVVQNKITVSTVYAAGIYLGNSELDATHTTFADNTNQATGGTATAIFVPGPVEPGEVPGGAPTFSTLAILNSILSGHDIGVDLYAGNSASLRSSLWNNTRFDWNGYGTFTTVTDNARGDPRFQSANNFRLRRDSAAFDIAAASSVATDLDGSPRPRGFAPDAGAYEHRYTNGLYLHAAASPAFALQGDTISYALLVRNQSNAAINNAKLTLVFPQSQPSPAISPGSCSGIFCEVNLGTLAADATAQVDITALVAGAPPATGMGNMLVNVTLSGDGVTDSDKTATIRTYLHSCRVRMNGTPYTSIQEAVDAAANGATIQVGGTCGAAHQSGGPGQSVALAKTLTIQGGWNADFTQNDPALFPTTIDAANLGRVFYITGNAAPTLENLNLRNGNASALGGGESGKDAGGGIYVATAGLTLLNVDVAQSQSPDHGAGLYLHTAAPVLVTNSAFRSNTAGERGGGVYIRTGSPIFLDVSVLSNKARSGGGYYIYQATPTIDSASPTLANNLCRINTNQATGSARYLPDAGAVLWLGPGGGGGIAVESAQPALRRCAITGNSAKNGAGLFLLRSGVTLENNLLSSNTMVLPLTSGDGDADGNGGGLHILESDPATVVMRSNALILNDAQAGSAIYARFASGATASINRTTIAHNTGAGAVYVVGQSDVSFADTILANNRGVAVRAATGSAGETATITLNRTLWYLNDSEQATLGGSASIVRANDFTGDPAFKNDGYHIKRISAAYDRGLDNAALADRDGDTRPQGLFSDLGADEYNPAGVVRYVALGGVGSAPCTNYLQPCGSIQTAINAAQDGDLIKITGGVYSAMVVRGGSAQVAYVDKSITIQGGYFAQTDNPYTEGDYTLYDWEDPHPNENPTVLDALNNGRALTIVTPNGSDPITPTFAFLTLRNGNAEGIGGGSDGQDAGGNVYAVNASPNFNTVWIEDGSGQQGAGIYLRDASGTLQATTLTGNTAAQAGGGVYVEGGGPILTQLTLQNNVAISGSAIYVAGGSATLIQNTATGNGGETSVAGGAFYLENSASTVLSNTVTGNRAALGGGLYLADDTSTVRGNTVATNQATGATGSRTAGGGLYIRGGEPAVEANAITGNKTLGTNCACGGGLHLDATAAHILANTITGNEAPAGGGLYAANATGMEIRDNLFTENRALPPQNADGPAIKGGGGILLASSSGTVEANRLVANRGDVGGGIYLTGASLALVTGNTLSGNIAARNGGGFFTQNSTAQVTANAVWGNTATQGSGGGFYLASGDTPGVIYAANIVTGNVAALSGGGFYLGAEGVRVENGTISGNRAADGAGIYVRGTLNSSNGSLTRIERTSIQNNIASNHGGGLFMRQSSARVQGLIISGNSAGADGGGAYFDESAPRLFADNLVQENTAGNRGGGLALVRRSHAILVSNAVIENEASDAGGIFIAGSSPTLEHTTLADNGKAILAESLNQDTASVSLLNTIIANHEIGVNAGSGASVSLQATLWDGNVLENLGSVQRTLDVDGSAAFLADGYHLGPTSDAIGKGLESAVGAFTDIDGQSRFQGTGPELGADELVADCDIVVGNNTFPVYHVLQDAIDVAPNNGLIRVAGTCTQLRNTGGRPQIGAISKDLTIRGGYDPANWQISTPLTRPTVLDAGELGRVFYITGGGNRVTLQGLILTGGTAAGLGGGPLDADAGGGLYAQNAEVILLDSRITGGTADLGGGIYANSQVVRLERNLIRFNRATQRGGGIYLANGGADSVVNANDLTNNEAVEGAGIYVTGGVPVVSGNHIEENLAIVLNGRGGGIHAFDSQAILRGNWLLANRAQQGGGAYLASTDGTVAPNFHNNVLARNRSEASGGALYILDTPLILRHNTFSANTYGQDAGGAIMVVADAVSPVTVELINSIVANHSTAISLTADAELFVRANLWHDNEANWPQPDGFPGTVTDLAGHQFADPLFIDPPAGNYHISANSPAVDRGVNAGINVDIDNQTRPGRLGFDIGADEFLAASFNVTLSALPNPVPSGHDINFTVEVVNNGDVDLTADIELSLPDVVTPKGPTIWSSVLITRNSVIRRETLATVAPHYTGLLEAAVEVTTLEGITGSADVSANAVDVDTEILDILAQTTPNPVPPNSEVRYQLRVTNKGAIPLNTTVEVDLPEGVTSASPLIWTPTIAGSDGIWSTSFRADVPANAPELLETIVRVSSLEGVSAVYTTTAELARPEVTAHVRGQPRPAIAGEPVYFTLGVTNTGNVALTAIISHALGGHMAVEGAAGALVWEVPLAPGASWAEEVSATVEAGYVGALESALDVQSSVASTRATDTFQSRRPDFEFSATARGGIWHNPDSWEPRGVPQADDVVHIPPGVVITLTQPAEVSGLRNEGDLRVTGDAGMAQKLSVAQAMENFGTITGLHATSNGAPGISLDLRAGTLYNEGTIRGGNGAPDGGAGGHVTISTTSLTNKGTIRAGDGAHVLSNNNVGPGGPGGNLIIILDPGLLVNDGTLASGNGGNAFANASPPQPGGPGGDVTIISPSTIDVDDSDVVAGDGGSGSDGASSGLQGALYIGAYRISTVDARLDGRAVTLVDGSQEVLDFTAQAPAVVRGVAGGFPIIFELRVVNRGSEADTLTISAPKVPEGWIFQNLPSFVSISPFRARVVTLALIPPSAAQATRQTTGQAAHQEASQAETAIELLVTSQANTSRKILLPIELGPPLSESLGTIAYLPLVATRVSASATASESKSQPKSEPEPEAHSIRAATMRADLPPVLFLPRIQDR